MPAARGVPSSLPARPPHFPRLGAPLPGLRLHRGPYYLASLRLSGACDRPPARPKALPGPAGVGSERRQVCLCGVSRGTEPPAPRPPSAPRGNPGEETNREQSKGKQPAWICLSGTFAAHADSLRERAGATAPPPPRPGGRGPRVGKLRRCGGSGCCRARGAPRCGPEPWEPAPAGAGVAGRRVAGAPLGARLRAWPAGPRRVPLLPASQLNSPRRD